MPILINNSIYFNSLISPLTLLVGLELLIAFLKLKPFSNKIGNEIASTTLGIYLIHDHFLMRNFLWGGGIFNNKIYFNSKKLGCERNLENTSKNNRKNLFENSR